MAVLANRRRSWALGRAAASSAALMGTSSRSRSESSPWPAPASIQKAAIRPASRSCTPSTRATANSARAMASAAFPSSSTSWKKSIVCLSLLAARPDLRLEQAEPLLQLVDGDVGVFLRQHPPVRSFKHGEKLHVFQ